MILLIVTNLADRKMNYELGKQAWTHYWAGAALNLISLQRGKDRNGEINCVTPAQYGGTH